MASITSITMTDDIDGGKAAETVRFSLDGAEYEIDLSTRNARALRKALAEYVGSGRKVPRSKYGSAQRRAPKAARGSREDLAAIRAWAAANGLPIAARGRIAADVRAQYEAAN